MEVDPALASSAEIQARRAQLLEMTGITFEELHDLMVYGVIPEVFDAAWHAITRIDYSAWGGA